MVRHSLSGLSQSGYSCDKSLWCAARKKWGDEQVHIWRRSYDVPPPGGESLELTAKRVLPYYEANIVPAVSSGKKVLVAAHGNSLRSMIMQLEGMSGEEIVNTELSTGVPIVYRLDKDGEHHFFRLLEFVEGQSLIYFSHRYSYRQGPLQGDPQARLSLFFDRL